MRSAVLPSQSDGIALAVNFGSEFVLLLKTGKNNLVENPNFSRNFTMNKNFYGDNLNNLRKIRPR